MPLFPYLKIQLNLILLKYLKNKYFCTLRSIFKVISYPPTPRTVLEETARVRKMHSSTKAEKRLCDTEITGRERFTQPQMTEDGDVINRNVKH